MVERLSFFQIAVLVSLIQCVLLSLFILRNSGGLVSNRLLGAILIIFTLIVANTLTISLNFVTRYSPLKNLVFFLSQLIYALPPLMFLFLKHYLKKSRSLEKGDYLHFIPPLLGQIYAVSIILRFPLFTIWVYPRRILLGSLFLAQLLFYVSLILRAYRKDSGESKGSDSLWFKFTLVVALALWLIQAQTFIFWDVLHLISSCPYYLSLYSLFAIVLLNTLAYLKLKYPNTLILKKYSSSGLDEFSKRKYLDELVQMMEEDELYLDPDINLPTLARELSVAPCHLSQLVNESFNMNFSDFINQYRIKESEILLEKYRGKKNIIEIAFDAGFNSKSTFNRVFKKVHGITPKAYQMGLRHGSETISM